MRYGAIVRRYDVLRPEFDITTLPAFDVSDMHRHASQPLHLRFVDLKLASANIQRSFSRSLL